MSFGNLKLLECKLHYFHDNCINCDSMIYTKCFKENCHPAIWHVSIKGTVVKKILNFSVGKFI